MKKIASIFAMLLIAFVVTFAACSSMTMGAAIGQLNSQCPVDFGNGVSMTSAVIDGNGNAVMTIEAPAVPSAVLGSDEMVSKMKSVIESDADFVKLMKDSKTKLIFRLVGSDDTVEATFDASDFK
jgi:hypothetical protein